MTKRGRDTELKFWDNPLDVTIPFTGALILGVIDASLLRIAQGTDDDERVGRKVIVHSFYIRGRFTMTSTLVGGATTVEMYLVQDKQSNGAFAGIGDVFDNGTNLSIAMPKLTEQDRFIFYKHWSIPFNAPAGVEGAYEAMEHTIDDLVECHIPIEYSGTTGAITEVRSNNLILIAGVSNTAADGLIALLATARIRFTD